MDTQETRFEVPEEVLAQHKMVFLKQGTNTLMQGDDLDYQVVNDIVDDMIYSLREGSAPIGVISGAVGMGRRRMISQKPDWMDKVTYKRLLSGRGQTALTEVFQRKFEELGYDAIQALLVENQFSDKKHRIETANTLLGATCSGIIPLLNGNDIVSSAGLTEKIVRGEQRLNGIDDNDTLTYEAVRLAKSFNAQVKVVILATSEDGLRVCKGGDLITNVSRISEDGSKIWTNTGEQIDIKVFEGSAEGASGQMTNKLDQTRKLMELGVKVIMAKGKERHLLRRILEGEELGTTFVQ